MIEAETTVDEDGAVSTVQPWLLAVAGRRVGVRVEVRVVPIEGVDDDMRAALRARQAADPFAVGEVSGALEQALGSVASKARAAFVHEHLVPKVVPA